MAAFRIFRRRPLVWLMLHTLLLFIGSAMMLVPVIGPLVFALLTPVFMAGLMVGCRSVENGGRVELGHLFQASGITRHSSLPWAGSISPGRSWWRA